jgi:lipoate-protein ligase A
METWRLIPLLDAPGTCQMAIDRWLFERHKEGLHPPTLRFYTWSEPTISLGYHQKHFPEFWKELSWQERKIHLVRRATGGRGVLHQGDLTYAIVLSNLPERRIDAYKTICQFLIRGWAGLGINLDYGSASRGYIHNPNCFGTATSADLIYPAGNKIIGSAQLRHKNFVLQHGSAIVSTDPNLFARVFQQTPPQTLCNILQQDARTIINTAIESLIQAAAECFGISFLQSSLSKTELKEILSFQTKP